MLRLISVWGEPCGLYNIDPSAQFEAGMIGGLNLVASEIFMTVSDGSTIQPFGILDNNRTQAFTSVISDESVIVEVADDGTGHSSVAANGYLNNPNIIPSTFISDVTVVLIAINGVITIPAGTALNYDNNDDGNLDSIRVICNYRYTVTGVPGDDDTLGSGKVNVWFTRGIYSSDQFDPTVAYPLNGLLYCNNEGRFSSTANGPALGMTVTPPSALSGALDFLWF